jgi:hypothetical protein
MIEAIAFALLALSLLVIVIATVRASSRSPEDAAGEPTRQEHMHRRRG